MAAPAVAITVHPADAGVVLASSSIRTRPPSTVAFVVLPLTVSLGGRLLLLQLTPPSVVCHTSASCVVGSDVTQTAALASSYKTETSPNGWPPLPVGVRVAH